MTPLKSGREKTSKSTAHKFQLASPASQNCYSAHTHPCRQREAASVLRSDLEAGWVLAVLLMPFFIVSVNLTDGTPKNV